MPKIKIPRKSTWVDMTAFVDVAFLILSFFMLVTKFKPEEAIPVTTPNSVSSQLIQEEDAFTVLIDSGGKVFIQLDPEMRGKIIENLNKTRSLGLNALEIKNFENLGNIGVSFQELKAFLSLSTEGQKKTQLYGVPMDDKGGELVFWIRDVRALTSDRKINWFIKADNEVRYPAFKNVLVALKKNDLNKFLLITNPMQPPIGSALYEKNQLKEQP